VSFFADQPPRWLAHFSRRVIARGAPGGVYLTFDDGPDPASTPEFLRVLAAHECKATFFMLGSKVKENPVMAKAVREAGHTIGVHGYSHESWLRMSADEIKNEIKLTLEQIESAAGVRPSICRPPYGRVGFAALRVARELEMKIVLWSLAPDDWRPTPPDLLVSRVLDKIHEGDIVLLHDAGKGAETTLKALPDLIAGLHDKGLKPLTLPAGMTG
jgi:peptidoglycan-N-acetylglucosamine deacetylase